MNAVSFDSVDAADAAFRLGSVRFKCLRCGRAHDSRSRGWEECALAVEKVDSRARSRFPWGRRAECSLSLQAHSYPGSLSAMLPGREAVLPKDLFSWFEDDPPAAPLPHALALTRAAFDEAVALAEDSWWERVVSRIRWMADALRSAFPETCREFRPVSAPAWQRNGDEVCLSLARLVFPKADGAAGRVEVRFHVGPEVTLWGVRLNGERIGRLYRALEGEDAPPLPPREVKAP